MRAVLALTAATFFWGLNFHLAKVMLINVGFLEAGFWRYLFAVVLLGFLGGKKMLSFRSASTPLKGISLVGIIGLFGFNIFFFWGMMYTSAVNAALIMSLNPALTLLLSNRLLKTPLPTKSLFGIGIAFVGIVYLVSKGNMDNLQAVRFGIGDLLIFIANILFALHHVWVKKYAHGISIMSFTFLTSLICMLCFLLSFPFAGTPQVLSYPGTFWLAVAGLGILGTALAYFLWNQGVKQIGADRAGVFMNVVPLSAAVLTLFFNEVLYSYHFISGILIVAGLMLTLFPFGWGKVKTVFQGQSKF